MKTPLTLFLITICSLCFGQKKIQPHKVDSTYQIFDLNELEKLTISDHDQFVQQVQTLQKELDIRDDEYRKFTNRLYVSRKIPMDRLGQGDSTKLTSTQLIIILKNKK